MSEIFLIIKFLYKQKLSVQEIAEKLNVSVGLVYKAIKQDKLVQYKTSLKNALYNTEKYKLFRKQILDRDKVCVKCQSSGSKFNPLQVDHYPYPKAAYPDKIFDPSNARVLCLSCHRKTDTFGRKKFNQYMKKSKKS